MAAVTSYENALYSNAVNVHFYMFEPIMSFYANIIVTPPPPPPPPPPIIIGPIGFGDAKIIELTNKENVPFFTEIY